MLKSAPLLLAVLALPLAPARAEEAVPATTVQGEATADLPPDAATVSLAVEAERPTAAAATGAVAAAAEAVGAALKADAVDELRTAAVALSPVYPAPDNVHPGQAPLAPRGFRAGTALTVSVRPAGRVGAVIAHAVEQGATGVDDLAFTADAATATLDRLRGAAALDARRKATLYVEALGLHLGRVLDITPEEVPLRPLVFAKAMRAAASPVPALPVAPDPLHLRAAVTVRFAIGP